MAGLEKSTRGTCWTKDAEHGAPERRGGNQRRLVESREGEVEADDSPWRAAKRRNRS